jgi:hypothetical protein
MSITGMRAVGDEISVRRAAANTSLTAGGAGDNTLVTGVIIDRHALGLPESAVLALLWAATLAASQTLSLGWTLQHGDAANLSDAATLASATPAVVATGAGSPTGQLEANVSLRGARRYLRLNFTPDLSAANTDTATVAAAIVFGGAARLPQ